MVRLGKMALPLVLVVALVTGCATTSPAPARSASGAILTGESTSRRAVESFMRAVKGQDLQQMATVWGTTKGPARDQMDRESLEKRLIIIQCTLAHDSWSFAEDEARLQTGGRQEFLVEVRKRQLRAKTSFTTVQGPGQRWYVEIVDMAPLKDFCA